MFIFILVSCIFWLLTFDQSSTNTKLIIFNNFILALIIGFDLIRDYDAYLYHLQAIRWAKEGFLHLGIANIHTRLGFQSIWFDLQAMFDLSGVFGYPLPLLNSLVALSSLVFLSNKVLQKRKEWFAYLVILLFLLFSTLDGPLYYLLRGYNPDIPAAFLTFAYFFVIYEAKRVDSATLKKLAALSLLALLIKLSTIPLLLYTAVLIIREIHLSKNAKQFKSLFVISIFVLFFYVYRNVMLTGYLLYPISFTQLPVSWAVPQAEVSSLQGVISSWAKIRAVNPEYFSVTNLSWIPTWLVQQSAQTIVTVLTGTTSSIGLVWLTLKKKNKKITLITLVIWGILLYWFLLAPDIRFGLGILFTAIFIFVLELIEQNYERLAYAFGTICIATLILVVPPITNYYHWFRMVPKLHPWGLQNFPTRQVTVNGHTYFVPLEIGEDRANFTDFPSAPQIDPCLQQKESGPFTIYYKKCN